MNHEKTYPNQPQQFYAPQNPQQNGYANAVPLPLHAVQSAPCLVDCPGCRVRQMTRVEAVSGGTTQYVIPFSIGVDLQVKGALANRFHF
jgi:hypothetical protein